MDFTTKYTNPIPESKANFISKFFFLWEIPLFRKGLRKDLEVEDLYNARKCDKSQKAADNLERNWNNEIRKAKLQNRKPKFRNAIYATFWKEYFTWSLLIFFQTCVLRPLNPILLGQVLLYFEESSPLTKEDGYLYASMLMVVMFVHIIVALRAIRGLVMIGVRCRMASCSLMYRKALRLSQKSLNNIEAGKLINLMSNDVSRFDMAAPMTVYIFIMPIQLTVISLLMFQSIGIAAFAGISCIVIQAVPIQGYLSKKMGQLRANFAKRTDERIRITSEIINGINVIKMYAWEKPFEALLTSSRNLELKVIAISAYFRGFQTALSVYTERLALFLTIITYVLLGHNITSDKIYPLAQYFNILQLVIALNFPLGISLRAEALITARRIEEVLLLEECDIPPPSNDEKELIKGITRDVKLVNVYASWSGSIAMTLSDITLHVKPGQLCAIVGPVGSGKSSLVQLLLRELPVKTGEMSIGGRVSYCSQEPWLFQGSVRNNILFGQTFNEKKYHHVVEACALNRDLEEFEYGDRSLVGARGTQLSGGQQARVNLARATYRDADIYLLDDPLSAVDTKVGNHLFQKCISGYLSDKTRILVTHQLQFLKDADIIVVIDNGHIIKMGTWDEISSEKALLNNISPMEDVKPHIEDPFENVRKRLSQASAEEKPTKIDEPEEKKKLLNKSNEPKETEELIEKGGISRNVFAAYLSAGGGIIFSTIVVLLLIGSQFACTISDYWYTWWTNKEDVRRLYLYKLGQNSTEPTPLNIRTYINATIAETEPLLAKYAGQTINTQLFSIYMYTALIVTSVLLTTASRILFFHLGVRASKNLHNSMANSIIRATKRFFDTNQAGRILNRFSKDLGAVDEALPKFLVEATQVFLLMIGILTILLIINPYLILPMLLASWCFNKIRNIYMHTARDVMRLEAATRSPTFSHVTASMDGISTIRACGAQPILTHEFDVQQDTNIGVYYLTITTAHAFGTWLDCISYGFMGLVIFSFLYLDDRSTSSGDVGLAISQTITMTGILQLGMRQLADLMNRMTSVERVLQYTKIEQEGPFESYPSQKPRSSWPEKGQVELKQLYLRYHPDEAPILKDLNIKFEAGTRVGIVGRTGAGKSSLVSALLRLSPTEGDVLIDGIDTSSVGLTDLRSRISIIPQSPVLFSATMRYNLDPMNTVDDSELWKVLQEVELKDVVETLDHKVNEGGSNFSVGQRQLLCLARAIIRNNKILILDEATANVDLKTDELIQKTIRRKFANCTILTIAHRLNTIIDYDMVIVMDDGCLVESGSPSALLQNKTGIFAQLVAETGANMEAKLVQQANTALLNKTNETNANIS